MQLGAEVFYHPVTTASPHHPWEGGHRLLESAALRRVHTLAAYISSELMCVEDFLFSWKSQ